MAHAEEVEEVEEEGGEEGDVLQHTRGFTYYCYKFESHGCSLMFPLSQSVGCPPLYCKFSKGWRRRRRSRSRTCQLGRVYLIVAGHD